MKLYNIIIVNLIFIQLSYSQDFHFAQFDTNPLYLNPALTGERYTDYKGLQINANYREQIANYTKKQSSFRSLAIGIDAPISSKFSIAELVSDNRSTNGTFNTLNVLIAGSYKIIDQNEDNHNQHNLSVGIQAGFINNSIHPESFTYDSQYSSNSSDGFDSGLPSGEIFTKQSFFKFDLNFGVYYRLGFNRKKTTLFSGFSMYHLTEPNSSYIGNSSFTPIRFNLHGGCIYKITDKLSATAQVLYMNQAKANELNIGVLMYYKIGESFYEPILGLSWRNKNAIIFQLGLRAKGTTFRMSYCLVTNYLKDYRNSGLEFSLITTLNKKEKSKKKSLF